MNVFIIVIDKYENPSFHNVAYTTRKHAVEQIKRFPIDIQYRCSVESIKLQKPDDRQTFSQKWETHKSRRISELKKRALNTNVRKIINEKERQYGIIA